MHFTRSVNRETDIKTGFLEFRFWPEPILFPARAVSFVSKEKEIMRKFAAFLTVAAILGFATASHHSGDVKTPKVLNFKMKGIDGKEIDLSQYKGKVVLFVNVASKCGLTPSTRGCSALRKVSRTRASSSSASRPTSSAAKSPATMRKSPNSARRNTTLPFPMLSKVVVKGEGHRRSTVLDLEGNQSQIRRRDRVELHQVPRQPRWRDWSTASSPGSPPIRPISSKRHRSRIGQEVTLAN